MARIFVSHASSNGDLVKSFVDTVLRLGCEVSSEDVFFSSGADVGVPIGADLNSFVRGQIAGDDTLVVAVITPAFLSRPYCLAELGAAWSRAGTLFPLMLPGMKHGELDGVLSGMLVKAIDKSDALDELSDRVGALLNRHVAAATWSGYRDQWLAELPKRLKAERAFNGGDEPTSVTSCSREPGHMEVFWTDRSSRVFYRWWLGDQGWSKPAAMKDVRADFVTAVGGDGVELLFGVKGVDEVWVRPWVVNERGWMTAGPVARIPGLVKGPLNALARGWEVELVAWSANGRQCHLWREGESWTDWSTKW